MSYSGEEKQTRRNEEGDTLNITILRQDSIVQNSSTLMDRGKGNYSALQKWTTQRERDPIERNAKFAAQLVTYSCAHMSRVSHWQARGS